jgi:hypothetical protein
MEERVEVTGLGHSLGESRCGIGGLGDKSSRKYRCAVGKRSGSEEKREVWSCWASREVMAVARSLDQGGSSSTRAEDQEAD